MNIPRKVMNDNGKNQPLKMMEQVSPIQYWLTGITKVFSCKVYYDTSPIRWYCWSLSYIPWPNYPSLPKSSNYLVSRCLGPLKVLSGGLCGSKYLLTRYLED